MQNLQAWAVYLTVFFVVFGFGGFSSVYLYRRFFKLSRAPTRTRMLFYSLGVLISLVLTLLALAMELDIFGAVITWYVAQFFVPTEREQ